MAPLKQSHYYWYV